MENLWGDFLDEVMLWFENPAPEFCPCCGLLIVPNIFRHLK